MCCIKLYLYDALPEIYIASYFGGKTAYAKSGAITADDDGNIFITGRTFTNKFQLATGPYVSKGTYDVFVLKFNKKTFEVASYNCKFFH